MKENELQNEEPFRLPANEEARFDTRRKEALKQMAMQGGKSLKAWRLARYAAAAVVAAALIFGAVHMAQRQEPVQNEPVAKTKVEHRQYAARKCLAEAEKAVAPQKGRLAARNKTMGVAHGTEEVHETLGAELPAPKQATEAIAAAQATHDTKEKDCSPQAATCPGPSVVETDALVAMAQDNGPRVVYTLALVDYETVTDFNPCDGHGMIAWALCASPFLNERVDNVRESIFAMGSAQDIHWKRK